MGGAKSFRGIGRSKPVADLLKFSRSAWLSISQRSTSCSTYRPKHAAISPFWLIEKSLAIKSCTVNVEHQCIHFVFPLIVTVCRILLLRGRGQHMSHAVLLKVVLV